MWSYATMDTLLYNIFTDETRTVVAIIAGVCSVVGVLLPPIRKRIVTGYRAFSNWRNRGNIDRHNKLMLELVGVTKKQDELFAKVNSRDEQWVDAQKTWEENSSKAENNGKAIEELKRIVSNGLSHSMATLKVHHKQDFEADPSPRFVSDETGAINLLSIGLLKVLGAQKGDIEDKQWRNAVHGEFRNAFITGFETAMQNKSSFAETVDFQHPVTGEHRGRWRVVADCDAVGSALIYSGRLIYAIDDRAKELAHKVGKADLARD